MTGERSDDDNDVTFTKRNFLKSASMGALFLGSIGPSGATSYGFDEGVETPGKKSAERGVAPHSPGWMLTPADDQIEVGDRPMGVALSPDGNYLAVSNDGQGVQALMLVNTDSQEVVHTITYESPEALFVGISFSPDGTQLYASAGANNKVRVYDVGDGEVTERDPIRLGPSSLDEEDDEDPQIFPAGLTVTEDGKRLFVANNLDDSMSVIDLESEEVIETVGVGNQPYTVALTPDETKAYVSNWGDETVSVIDTESYEMIESVLVGMGPNAVVADPERPRMYVADGNNDTVSVIETETDETTDWINLEPYEGAPYGSLPNALAISDDGTTLYVANGANNDVAVVDLDTSDGSVDPVPEVTGLIPTGWFPSALALDPKNETLYVANMKGVGSGPNPNGPNPAIEDQPNVQYIGNLIPGSLSVVDVPNEDELEKHTEQVVENNGFDETSNTLLREPEATEPKPIPDRLGDPSPIEHVIYVIKENRTYDQIFGDLDRGNGEPELTLFDEASTPNHRALAKEFVLFDNFYVDAEVSPDGHNWSVGAIADDYTQKTWPTLYGGRGRSYVWEDQSPARPGGGWLWNAAEEAGVSFRSYGEFTSNVFDDDGNFLRADPSVAGLEGHIDPDFPSYDMSISDQTRLDIWLEEFREYEENGNLPELSIVRLPRDHTSGTRPDAPTPQAMMADNDLALGRLVEAVSASEYWENTAIFVVEDDAQNGPDHVDAHRSIALAISPYTRRGVVDSTFYSTVSVLRSMELMLGIRPLSQFDARATPMDAAFIDPDEEPALDFEYSAITPEQPLDEMNTQESYGVEQSLELDLSEEDRAAMQPFNRILWHDVKGADVPMPEPKFNFRLNASPQGTLAAEDD